LKYFTSTIVNDVSSDNLLRCITSNDNENDEYLFAGLVGSIKSVDVQTMTVKSSFEIKDADNKPIEITKIKSIKLRQSVYFVISISTNGFPFLHLFALEKFYPIQHLFTDNDADRKFINTKCELAYNCEYMALLNESKINLN
jgi:hypothetical protein